MNELQKEEKKEEVKKATKSKGKAKNQSKDIVDNKEKISNDTDKVCNCTVSEEKPKLKVELLHKTSRLPVKPTTDNDAGYDIFSHTVKSLYIGAEKLTKERIKPYLSQGKLELRPGARALIGSGIKATVANGWEIQVRSKSGCVLKRGLVVLNSPGTVDSEFRNELGIIICNQSMSTQYIAFNEAIAQIVPKRVEHLEIEVCKLDDVTKRGDKGYGHSDKKNNGRRFDVPSHLVNNDIYGVDETQHIYVEV